MGVITTVSLPAGRVYGPIPPNITLTDPMVMIGHMTTDNRPDVHTVKVDIEAYGIGGRLAEWIPYVQAARDEREQNVEAFIKDGQLFYRTVTHIQDGSELLVWYSSDLAQIIGVPELHSSYIKDGGSFCCPYCRKWFRFPNCLRAHMRFKCESSRHIYSTVTTTKATNNISLSMPTPLYHPHHPAHSAAAAAAAMALSSPLLRSSPSRTANRDDRLSEGGISPGSTSSGVSSASMSPPTSSEKRKFEDDDDAITASKRFLSQDLRSRSPDDISDSKYSKSPSPNNNNIQPVEDTGSAFRKVEQRGISIPSSISKPSPPPPQPSSNQLAPQASPPSGPSFRPPPQLAATNPYAMIGLQGLMRPGMAQHPYILPGQPQTSSALPNMASMYKENIPVSLADITRLANGLPVRARLPDIHAIQAGQAGGKVPFHPDWRFHFPYYKSQNPIVETILHSAASGGVAPPPPMNINLLQNWCAKCNATFRMTSDLVYHMRSQHKSECEKEMQETKPEGKLECNFCGERFKERHHLTRHMTAHQEAK